MFIEIRQQGKRKKYYLSHTYRKSGKVIKVSRYLGANLNGKNLETLRERAEALLRAQIAQDKNPFSYELSAAELAEYKKYDKKIDVQHLQRLNWQKFAEVFTYNTNAIEGSSLDQPEVRELLRGKLSARDEDELETIGVAEAITYIKQSRNSLTPSLIRKLHHLCFRQTKHYAGKFRTVEVVVRDRNGIIIHQGMPAKKVPKLIKELCTWYERHKRKYPPLLLAAITHNQFEMIHPFQDGNGRVGRLLLNHVLIQNKYPPINIRLKERMQYYGVLQEYQKRNTILPTLKFLIRQYRKEYR